MARFVFKNQSQTTRGYLAVIKCSHKMFAGWELPTFHCIVLAVGKGIDRAQGKSDVRPRVEMPLMWNMLTEVMDRVIEVGPEGSAIWRGLAFVILSFVLQASEIWTYGNGLVHPDFCLTGRDMIFFAGASNSHEKKGEPQKK